ncbi:MAG: hypothetical protein JO202_18145 [Ktedonobacteraceae bacterium]|nr:hypothetical protein [Ktedonobacteraceae bacterium]
MSVSVNRKSVAAHSVKSLSLGQKATQAGPLAAVPGLGNVTATFVDVGASSTNELILTITGLSFATDSPTVILLQPRQNVNEDFGFSDEFAVMVNTTSFDTIECTIKRLDSNQGWGQDLRLDIFVVE